MNVLAWHKLEEPLVAAKIFKGQTRGARFNLYKTLPHLRRSTSLPSSRDSQTCPLSRLHLLSLLRRLPHHQSHKWSSAGNRPLPGYGLGQLHLKWDGSQNTQRFSPHGDRSPSGAPLWMPPPKSQSDRSKTKAGFPGGPVVANLPASAGDAGLISGLGGAHSLRSLCPRAKGLHLLKPECLNPELGDRSHASEKHVHRP